MSAQPPHGSPGAEPASPHVRRAPIAVAGVAVTLVIAASLARSALHETPEPMAAQEAAQAAGFDTLSFSTDFDDLTQVDLTGRGTKGKSWFVDRPFSPKLAADDLSVHDSVLTLDQSDNEGPNLAISSVSSLTGEGQTFRYGWFEARIRFNPANAPRSTGWPSFWMMSADHFKGTRNDLWGEIDIVELHHEPREAFKSGFSGSIWTHTGAQVNTRINRHHSKHVDTDWSAWHTYSCVWTPGEVVWFMDGREVLRHSYAANSQASRALDGDTGGQALVLGTGRDNPMEVDWVRVWQ
ncbi:glycosyl hydrolase family 16 [Luteococcus japonicus]|uniref:Glycosyl hydrolase family 16 n=1 Tax=Luteococcus japonicus TaxID=33984 RepID=A0A3N1ZXL6_9ACTN|nr:glycoside hydrolase family 16 protein [Luteococcus japonicus]ROR55237.1 glycosyl hydrolase family 16 [Luteococcus japonicus]